MQDNSKAQTAKLLYTQVDVRKEFDVSQVTWYRWKKAGVVPGPDIEIRNKFYYSAERRREMVDALLGKGVE